MFKRLFGVQGNIISLELHRLMVLCFVYDVYHTIIKNDNFGGVRLNLVRWALVVGTTVT